MQASDFLKRGARTPLHGLFLAGGAVCEIRTNSTSILNAARVSFLPAEATDVVEFGMRFWEDSRVGGQAPWPKPYVRGLDQMVFAGFDRGSSVLINLRSREAIGRFSAGMAGDSGYWAEVILPMIVSMRARRRRTPLRLRLEEPEWIAPDGPVPFGQIHVVSRAESGRFRISFG
jgi:hypothetical protein